MVSCIDKRKERCKQIVLGAVLFIGGLYLLGFSIILYNLLFNSVFYWHISGSHTIFEMVGIGACSIIVMVYGGKKMSHALRRSVALKEAQDT